MLRRDDAYWDGRITEAIERAVGFYYEKTKHDIGLVLEAIDSMKLQVDKIPGMEEDIAVIKSDLYVVKHALKATNMDLKETNKDLRELKNDTNRRLARLEATV